MLIRPLSSCLIGLVTFFSWPAVAQTTLILPQSAEDIRALSKQVEKPATCPPCGVVTNIQPVQRDPLAKDVSVTPEPGLETTAVFSSTTPRKELRKARQPQTETFYKLTVRLDDGTYAFYEQDNAPSVQKGDRIAIVDGNVVLRTP